MIPPTLLLLLLSLLPSSSATSSICPESPVSVFARCEMTVSFHQSCRHVQSELKARLSSNKWIDPHNHGTYTLKASNSTTLHASHLTGTGLYTDQLAFQFVDTSTTEQHCTLHACSTSQVTSLLDYSTNYCNLYNLYHGGEFLKHKLTVKHEAYPDCWQRRKHRCRETYTNNS